MPTTVPRWSSDGLLAEPPHLAWWHEHVRFHNWDRGGNGDRTLKMGWDWEIP